MLRYAVVIAVVMAATSLAVEGTDMDSVYFDQNSKPLNRNTWKAGKVGEISFSFRTNQPKGVFLYQGGRDGNGHFFSVGLSGGIVQLLVSVGGDNLLFMDTATTDDCKWHRVEVVRDGLGRGELVVDERRLPLSFNDPKGNFNMGGLLYIGGVMEDARAHPFALERFGDSYFGCVGGLSLLSKPISVIEIAKKQPDQRVGIGCETLTCGTTQKPTTGCEDGDDSITFDGSNSYLNFPTWTSGKKRGELYLKFKTTQADAVLINQEGKFRDDFSVQLRRGMVMVTMNVGGGPSELAAGRDLNDGMWHDLMMSREGAQLFLTVDKDRQSTELAAVTRKEDSNTFFEAIGPLSFGGASDLKNGEKSFTGCIKSLQIGTKMINPMADSESNKGVMAGCCIMPAQNSTTMKPTTMKPTTMKATTEEPTTEELTTMAPTTMEPTTEEPTTMEPTTMKAEVLESTSQYPCPVDDSDCDEESGDGGSAKDEVTSAPTVTETVRPSVKIIHSTTAPPREFNMATFVKGSQIKYTPAKPLVFPQPLKVKFSIATVQSEAAIIHMAASANSGLLVHLTGGRVALSLVENKVRRRRTLYEESVFVSSKVNDGSPHSIDLEIATAMVTTTVDVSEPMDAELRFKLPLRIVSVHIGKSEVSGVPGFAGVMRAVEFNNMDILAEAAKGHKLIKMVDVELVSSATMPPKGVTKTEAPTSEMTEMPCQEDDEDCDPGSEMSGSGMTIEPSVSIPPDVIFKPNSNMVYEPTESVTLPDPLELDLNFGTVQEEACLMYFKASEDSGVLLHLSGGRVTLTLIENENTKRGRRQVNGKTVTLTDKVNDGLSHAVQSTISGTKAKTAVDGGKSKTAIVPFDIPQSVDSLHVGSSPVAGVPGFEGRMAGAGFNDLNVIDEVRKGNPDVTAKGITIGSVTPTPKAISTATTKESVTTTSPPKTKTDAPISIKIDEVTTKPPAKGTEHPKTMTDKPGQVTKKSTDKPRTTPTTDVNNNFAVNEGASGLSGGTVAGIIVGIVLAVLVLTAVLVFVIMRYQRRDEGSYTLDEESPAKNGVPNNAKAKEADNQEWYM